MKSQVINQSGDANANSEQSSTTTTTTQKNETTSTTVEQAGPPEVDQDPYSDQVSRANHHRTTTTTVIDPSSFDPSSLAPGTSKQDFVNEGEIQPTIYYNAIIDDDKACEESAKVTLHGLQGAELAKVCPKTLNYCGLQGSCTIVSKGKTVSYNVINRYAGVDHFVVLDVEECPFGLGVRSICLDPFYTVAADLKIYKPGDVIFIPQMVGQELLGGKKHTGFFVVRDQGRGIIGKGRFDFFSGFYSWRDKNNPLSKVKLHDQTTRMIYYRVTGNSAKSILEGRLFPSLPTLKKAP